MRPCIAIWFASAALSCARPAADRNAAGDRSTAPAAPAAPATGPTAPTPADPVPMTHTDPNDPASWTWAENLAAGQNAGKVQRRSAALPFLFSAERGGCILIHRGAVISQRGPAVAGAYLRDLGVPQGKGPDLDDVLWALWALDALPDVTPLAREGYINVPDNKRLADLTARIEHDGSSARVVLHYFKPEPKQPPGVHRGPTGGSTGGPTGGRIGKIVRELVRTTLEIPPTGDAAWRREDIRWEDPA